MTNEPSKRVHPIPFAAAERTRRRRQHRKRLKRKRKAEKAEARAAKRRIIVDDFGDPCPRCGVPMQIREHNGINETQLRQPFFYTRWFCCMNRRCKTMVMPERYKVLQPVVLGDTWDDVPDASERPPWEVHFYLRASQRDEST